MPSLSRAGESDILLLTCCGCGLTTGEESIFYAPLPLFTAGKTWLLPKFHLFSRHNSTPPRLPRARLLLEAGAEVDAANNFGETPLMKAVRNNNTSTMTVLLEAGANQAWKDSLGWQVVCIASELRLFFVRCSPDPASWLR